MKHSLMILSLCLVFVVPAAAQYSPEQQFDIGVGVGTVMAPPSGSATGNHSPQTLGGGAYLNFSGDYVFWRHVGIEGEVAWRASRNLWGGYQPFRPIFYDFNAIYAPPLGKYLQLELVGGIGGLSTRFYTQTYTCNYFTYQCTNYVSTNHFMADVGAGVRLYLGKGVFVRPEFREYFIHDNVEFSSGHATRAGVTLGYSFGHQND